MRGPHPLPTGVSVRFKTRTFVRSGYLEPESRYGHTGWITWGDDMPGDAPPRHCHSKYGPALSRLIR